MDSDDISVDDYNSFVQEYGDFVDIALGEGSGTSFVGVRCDGQ